LHAKDRKTQTNANMS